MARPSSPARRRGPRVEETSAGGVILDRPRVGPPGGDPDGEPGHASPGSREPRAALIARRDRHGELVWCLPKGHVEAGETLEAAAVREVFEETGISGHIVAPLGTIDFWFMADETRIHKTVHHFLLQADGGSLSDDDAEVAEVAWVPLGEVASRLRYADERGLIARVSDLLADHGSADPA